MNMHCDCNPPATRDWLAAFSRPGFREALAGLGRPSLRLHRYREFRARALSDALRAEACGGRRRQD